MSKHFLTGALLVVLTSSGIVSCSGTPSVGKKQVPGSKMTAKEKLAKNHILDRDVNDWYKMKLAGRVKAITMTTYSISGTGEKTFDSKKSESLDPNGNCLEYATYDRSGKITDKQVWMYDANNNDTVHIIYAADAVSSKKVFKYDTRGNQVEEYEYAADGTLSGTCTYKYDAKGDLVESAYANGYGKGRYTYTYDANGFTTGRNYYDSSGKLLNKFAYKVDKYGNQLESIFYNEDGSVDSKYLNTYDEFGNSTETVLYKSGVSARVVAKYDGNGNKTGTDVYGTDGKLSERASSTQELVYDKTGNIIKDTKFKLKNGSRTAVEVTEKEIVYY